MSVLDVLEVAEDGTELQEQRVSLQDSDEGGMPRRWTWERLRPVVREKVPVDNRHEDQALRLGRGNLSKVCLLRCAVLEAPLVTSWLSEGYP